MLKVDREYCAILPPEAKERVVAAGYGSIRIAHRTQDSDHFMYMSLVDKDHWHCDLGVPVVVTRQAYEAFYRYSDHGAPWLSEIEGVLHVNEDLPFDELMPKAIGASLTPETEATLRYRSGLPKCYIYVTSPLAMKLTYNDSHPSSTAWALFQSKSSSQPYRYTYTMFNPIDDESINAAVAFIRRYVEHYQGKKIITDFDGQVPRLEASIPLKTHPLKSRDSKAEVVALVDGFNKWIATKLRRINRDW